MKKLKYLNFVQTIINNTEIGILQLNNVNKKNALNQEMLKEILCVFENLNRKSEYPYDIKVVIIESLCDKVFSSGHDLEELYQHINEQDRIRQIMDDCSKTMLEINKSNMLVIAEVDGLATAAGLQLALSCDLIVASFKSKFSIPGAKIGLYAATPAVTLIKQLPSKIAFEMLMFGRVFDANEMYRLGVVNKIVDDVTITEKETVKQLLRNESISISKQFLKNDTKFLEEFDLFKSKLYSI